MVEAEATLVVDMSPHPIGAEVTKGTTGAENAMRVAGAITMKAGIIMAAGAETAVAGTKTASSGYAGKPSLRHVPGVGAQSCTDARTGPPRYDLG